MRKTERQETEMVLGILVFYHIENDGPFNARLHSVWFYSFVGDSIYCTVRHFNSSVYLCSLLFSVKSYPLSRTNILFNDFHLQSFQSHINVVFFHFRSFIFSPIMFNSSHLSCLYLPSVCCITMKILSPCDLPLLTFMSSVALRVQPLGCCGVVIDLMCKSHISTTVLSSFTIEHGSTESNALLQSKNAKYRFVNIIFSPDHPDVFYNTNVFVSKNCCLSSWLIKLINLYVPKFHSFLKYTQIAITLSGRFLVLCVLFIRSISMPLAQCAMAGVSR